MKRLMLGCAMFAPLSFGWTAEDHPKPTEAVEHANVEASEKSQNEDRGCHRHWRWKSESHFQGTALADLPVRDLKTALDGRTGFGLGVQWTRDHREGHASRTRLEWNVFPEGQAVSGLKTRVSNYTLSFDHLYHFSQDARGIYVLGGIGAVRWFMDRTENSVATSTHTTKLGVTAGLGWRIAPRVSMEARYVVSSLRQTFDANMVQMGIGFGFK